MRVVTVVQARSGSTRLPGKVMEDLGGRPVLARMLERVRASRLAGTVVLATTTDASDEPVAAISASMGVPVVRGHPTDLLDRHVQAGRAHHAVVVVKIPSDCVLIGPEVIDEVIGAYLAAPDQLDYVSNLHPPTHPDGNDVEVMPMALLERAHREATREMDREHTTPWFWDPPGRFRCLNVAWSDGRNLARSHRVVLDYREDLALLRAVFAGVQDRWPTVTTAEIADWMDAHPEAMQLNAHLNGVNWYRHHLDELTAVTADDTRTPSPAQSPTEPRMNTDDRDALGALALRVREHCIRMSTDGGCFLGASLSCADLIVHLYSKVLKVSPATLQDPNRDYLLLSKGHDVPALYGTLAELGYFPRERLANHLKPTDKIYWHPNRAVPGVEFHSGSLGHLLSVSAGIAYDIKLRGGTNKVFVIVGDGELNEGTMWEGLLVASAQQLDNLVVIVDRNEFQANIRTEELVPLEPLLPKFAAFGANAVACDGHDFDALEQAFSQVGQGPGPSVIVAQTVRGKGLPSIEKRADRWFVNFSHDEINQLMQELHGEAKASLASETLMVR